MDKTNTHFIEISCETTLPGRKTETPVQLATEGDGSLGHWLASFRSVLVAAGFDSAISSRLKIVPISPEDQIMAMRSAVEEKHG